MPTFSEIFSPVLARHSIGCLVPRRVTHDSSYNIYPIAFLNHLIDDMKRHPGDEEYSHVVRFLVDTLGQLWFAREGGAGKVFPAHYQITGESANSAKCLTAGNIEFSADYTKIVSINHKSGDFRPPFESLRWLLAILVANEDRLATVSVRLADTITLQKLSSSGGRDDEPTYSVEKSELERVFADEVPWPLRGQPTAMRETRYSSDIKRRRTALDGDFSTFSSRGGAGGAASSGRLLFATIEPADIPGSAAGARSADGPPRGLRGISLFAASEDAPDLLDAFAAVAEPTALLGADVAARSPRASAVEACFFRTPSIQQRAAVVAEEHAASVARPQ